MRHGQRVRHWQLGSADRPEAFDLPRLPQLLPALVARLRAMTPRPAVTLPWRIDQPRPTDLTEPVTYLIDVPPTLNPALLGTHLSAWTGAESGGDAADVILRLRQPPATMLTHDRRVNAQTLAMLEGTACASRGRGPGRATARRTSCPTRCWVRSSARRTGWPAVRWSADSSRSRACKRLC